jgi:hypothetical protein
MNPLDGSPSARYRSSQRESTPPISKALNSKGTKAKRDVKPTVSPRKSVARAPSIEVSDGEGESSIDAPPDLDMNPIMDLHDEDDAVMTGGDDDNDNDTSSQAEEDNELEISGGTSSEGEGDTIQSEDISVDEYEDSDDIAAIAHTDEEEEDDSDEDDDEDEDPPRKYVFEPLRQPGAATSKKPTATTSKAKTKPKRFIVSSSEDEVIEDVERKESFDVDRISVTESDEPSLPAKKARASKTKSGATASRTTASKVKSVPPESVVDDSLEILEYSAAPKKSTTTSNSASTRKVPTKKVTQEEVEDLTDKIGKTNLGKAATAAAKSKAVRKSTRSKA